MIEIKILGTPSFERDGVAVAADTRKASALLAYLAVEGATRRESLAALFWPESADAQARASLRRTLSALRSGMGDDVVTADRDQVSLTEEVSTDLTRFHSALAETGRHDHGQGEVCAACIDPLRRAVATYRGEFMAGFSIRDAPEYEDWTRATAEGLRLDAGRACERLGTALAAEGDYRSAIEVVNIWLELDPLREPAYRQLMMLNAWAGDGAGATEAYRRCVSTLSKELGVDPLEETTELHEAILDDDLPPAPGLRKRIVARPADDRFVSADLIDRETERETLFAAARSLGDGRIVRIVGDAWLGKTRLLDELRRHNQDHSITTISAHGYRAERELPYGVVSQLLASLVGLSIWPALERETSEWVLSEAARIHPALGVPTPVSEGDVLGETRLYDAVLKLLTATPKVIVVDDIQWADRSSLALLAYLIHRIATAPILLVVAHRPEEDAVLDPVIEAAGAVGATELTLGPLTAPDLDGMTQHAEEVIAQTGGIPALVSESLRTGQIGEPTPGIRRYIDARLAGLDSLAMQVLSTAAVLSGTCDLDVLRVTSGRSDDEVVNAVETLMRRGVMRATSGGGLEFSFANMESLVYEDITPVRRRVLHRRAARAIEESTHSETDAALATTVARHSREGGLVEAAAHWFRLAGDLSRRVFAPAEAISSYRAALAQGSADLPDLHLGIGEALLFQGRFSDARTEFEKAAASSAGSERALSEHRIGEANRRLGRLEVAISQFELAQANHPDPAALYSDWALALLRVGDRKGARDKAERAVNAASGETDSERSRALAVLGTVTDDRAEAKRVLDEALELAREDPPLRMAALNALGHLQAQEGEQEEALQSVGEALEIATRIGDRHRQAALHNHLADLHHRAGRKEEAEKSLTEAVKLFAEVEPGAWEPEVWLLSRW